MMIAQEVKKYLGDLEVVGVRVAFKTGGNFVFVNITPHDITFKDPVTEMEFIVPKSGVLINAKPVEKVVATTAPIQFVTTQFRSNPEDAQKIVEIEKVFKTDGDIKIDNVIVIGSIIAAQAYPEKVVAMTPHPDYVRVVPSEKRMNPRKFTVYV